MEKLLITPEDEPSALIACRLFTEVSATYPASMATQAAGVAMHCNEMNVPAAPLGRALLEDPAQIQLIVERANNAHRHMNMPIHESQARGVIRSVFKLSHAMQASFSPESLSGILETYPEIAVDSFALRELNREVCRILGFRLNE